jgi:hypothetical protein
LEPTQTGRGIFTYQAQTALFTVSFPYSFIADLLIAFYWQSLLNRSEKLSKATVSLNKLKIPFVIICVILIVVEHTSTSIRGERLDSATALVILSAVLIMVSLLGIGSFYIWTGVRVIHLIDEITGGTSKVTKRVRNTGRNMWLIYTL